jgi:hypothetical protein
MPLQNRVTPFGEIVAVAERGTMLGNRGILHDADGRIHRRWAGRAWICCRLEFRGRRDPVMAPGHYTRLFFLDEPTALAAGHRPCAYCRREAFLAFRSAWAVANVGLGFGPTPRAAEIDRVLHAERIGPGGSKRLHSAELAGLPDGAFFVERPGDDTALLRWGGGTWRWTPGGYESAEPVGAEVVLTLTPPSIVAALAAGYQPGPPTLGALSDRGRSP